MSYSQQTGDPQGNNKRHLATSKVPQILGTKVSTCLLLVNLCPPKIIQTYPNQSLRLALRVLVTCFMRLSLSGATLLYVLLPASPLTPLSRGTHNPMESSCNARVLLIFHGRKRGNNREPVGLSSSNSPCNEIFRFDPFCASFYVAILKYGPS